MHTLKQLFGAASVLLALAVVTGVIALVQPAQAASTPDITTTTEILLITQTQITSDVLESQVDAEAFDYAALVPNPLPPRTDAPIWITFGQTFTYTFTITNLSAGVATKVVFVDTLPESVSLQSVSPSQGSCRGTVELECDLGDIEAGGVAKIYIEVLPNTLGLISNTGRVASNATDPNKSNNYRVKLHIVTPPEEVKPLVDVDVAAPETITSTETLTSIQPTSGTISVAVEEDQSIYLPVIMKEGGAE